MISHGNPFTLLRQARPTFQRTALGLFDTGSRQFKCSSKDAYRILQRDFRAGVSDFEILKKASGGTVAGHTLMYVSSADIEHEELGKAVLSVKYEGLLFDKDASGAYSTAIEEQVAKATKDYSYQPIRFDLPVPSFVHSYVVVGNRPSAVECGAQKDPPGIRKQETEAAKMYSDDFNGEQRILFEGWVLSQRTMRAPGDHIYGVVWQVVDTYQFKKSVISA